PTMSVPLPTARLRVGTQGLDWSWVLGNNSTDADCPGARRFALKAGAVPAWQPCLRAPPPEEPSTGGWCEWFGIGRSEDPATQVQPESAPPSPAALPQQDPQPER